MSRTRSAVLIIAAVLFTAAALLVIARRLRWSSLRIVALVNASVDALAIEEDEAARRLQETGDHFDDRALARAIRAQNAQNLAAVDAEADLANRHHGAVALIQATRLEDRVWH